METVDSPASNRITNFASRLRFPQLLVLVVVLFVIDVIIPDFIPFIDELILGVLALVLASLKKRVREEKVEGQDTTTGPNQA